MNKLQPGTCYERSIYPQMNTCDFYKVYFEVLYEGIHARKHARSPVPRGGRPRWSVPRTQRRRMKRSCYRWKRKERPGHRKSSLTLRRLFSPSPSCARVAVYNFSSMTRTDVQGQCRSICRFCCCSLTTAKRCRSCWSCRVVGYAILSKHSIQSSLSLPCGRPIICTWTARE